MPATFNQGEFLNFPDGLADPPANVRNNLALLKSAHSTYENAMTIAGAQLQNVYASPLSFETVEQE